MPFKVTNHPPRPRASQSSIHALANSGSPNRTLLVNQPDSDVAGEEITVPFEDNYVAPAASADADAPDDDTVDRADHVSLHSCSEETAFTSRSSVGDLWQAPLQRDMKNSYSSSSSGKNKDQQLPDHPQPNSLHAPHLPHSTSTNQGKGYVGQPNHYDAEAPEDYNSIAMRSSDLILALGPDNVRFTTEIEDIPCAGVRIAFGPLAGLLAWRLVVRRPLAAAKRKRSWWGMSEPRPAVAHLAEDHNTLQAGSGSSTPFPEKQQHLQSSRSAASLPYLDSQTEDIKHVPDMHHRQHSEAQHPLALEVSSQAIVANFVLDTSSPFSIISRDTLSALGHSLSDTTSSHNPQISPFHTETEPMVTLFVQNVRTQFRIAQHGEASRLGVQFMQDANVSLFFPREHGIGPVLYYDSARPFRDIPATVPLSSHHHYNAGRLSLPQRIRLIFGLSS